MKNNKVKNVIIFVLSICLVSLTILYAVIAQKLNVENYNSIKSSDWSIGFDNLSSATYNEGASILNEPVISSSSITGLSVLFSNPGDYVYYDFDIVNNGNIDAKISDISTSSFGAKCVSSSSNEEDEKNVCDNIRMTLTYAEASTVAVSDKTISLNSTLEKGNVLNSKKKIRVRFKIYYAENDNNVSSSVSVTNLNAYILYEQK